MFLRQGEVSAALELLASHDLKAHPVYGTVLSKSAMLSEAAGDNDTALALYTQVRGDPFVTATTHDIDRYNWAVACQSV